MFLAPMKSMAIIVGFYPPINGKKYSYRCVENKTFLEIKQYFLFSTVTVHLDHLVMTSVQYCISTMLFPSL